MRKSKGKSEKKNIVLPSHEQIAEERRKISYKTRYRKTLVSTVSVLVVVAALAVLISTIFLPVIQVSGTSMTPTLTDGDVLVLFNSKRYDRGDLCCISWGNKKLLKRVVGLPGDEINMDIDGNVYVNDEIIDEPYVTEKALGECDIEFPCLVPDNCVFILGDHRTTSIDSRSSAIGCVSNEQITGRVILRVWPLEEGFKVE